MIIGVWGQAGTGNSVLAESLAFLFSKRGTVLLIHTDLTQPTLPVMLNGENIDKAHSLGRALKIGMKDVTSYMHQHKSNKRLFYAGLSDKDNILSHEIGIEATSYVERFIENCKHVVDNIIIDLSPQRNDPFLPFTLSYADKVIMPLVPNTKGVTRHISFMELVFQLKAADKILPVAAEVFSFHDIKKIEKAANIEFAVVIPFLKDVAMCMDTNKSVMDVPKYAKQVRKLYRILEVQKNEHS